VCASEASISEKLCQEFWKHLTDTQLQPSAVTFKRENHSSNKEFAMSSARLIQGTRGGRIEFISFQHQPFAIKLPDRKVEENLFAFDFGSDHHLKRYLSGRPEGSLGKRGILTAKAPQQFEVGVKGNCLLVLVIDGVRMDGVVNELFERFQQMTKE